VPLCHPGDFVPYDTQQQHTDGPQQKHVDDHSKDSVRKKITFLIKITNKKFHENLSVGNLFNPHGKRNELISPSELLQATIQTFLSKLYDSINNVTCYIAFHFICGSKRE
jgi:hypothetical protein